MADSSVISVNGIGVSQPEATAVFFPMRDPVVFPFGLTPLLVDGEDKLAILRRAMASDRLLAIFPEMPDDEELGTLPVKVSLKIFTYAEKRRSMVGVLARVVKELKFPDGSVRIVVRGVKRISFSKLELERVEAKHFQENARSGRSLQLAGMKKTGEDEAFVYYEKTAKM